jgi:citrate synthase
MRKEPPVPAGTIEAPRGLKGVIVADTSVGDVRGEEGFYHYRQYAAPDLAATRSFEDVWWLLFEGELPAPTQRAAFLGEIARGRVLPDPVLAILPALASSTHQRLGSLRTALSHLADVEAMPAMLDADRATIRANIIRMCAAVPVIVAALDRLSRGLELVVPDPSLGTAANYLLMLEGEVPDPARARAIEQYLILAIDHGFNASTFTARVVTSTKADVGAAIVAALSALSGPLHGGSPSRALDSLDAIGTPANAEAWVRDAVLRGDRIMGFGHPVYRTADPRSTMLRGVAQQLGGPLVDFATTVEGTIERTLAELKPGRELHTNIEYYAAVVMELCGLPRELFSPTFAVSRVVGWGAQILEQAADTAIIRPSARYVGPPAPQPVPAA